MFATISCHSLFFSPAGEEVDLLNEEINGQDQVTHERDITNANHGIQGKFLH